MKAITVRQPWAWAIIHGGKGVENRTRNIAGGYRGPLLIHVGLTIDGTGDDPRIGAAIRRLYVEPRREVEDVPSRVDSIDPWLITSPWFGLRGAVIGVVDLVGVHHPDGTLFECCTSQWADPFSHHLVLGNPRPLPEPIPHKGRLGLWEFPDELLPEVAW